MSETPVHQTPRLDTPTLDMVDEGEQDLSWAIVPRGPATAGSDDPGSLDKSGYLELLKESANPSGLYRRLARMFHPDKVEGREEDFLALNEAYQAWQDERQDEEREVDEGTQIEGTLAIGSGALELPEPEPLAIEAPAELMMIEAPPVRSVMDETIDAQQDYRDTKTRLFMEQGQANKAKREREETARLAAKAKEQREAEEAAEAKRLEAEEAEEAKRLEAEAEAQLSERITALVAPFKALKIKPDGLGLELKNIAKEYSAAKKSGQCSTVKADLLARLATAASGIEAQAQLATDEEAVQSELEAALQTLITLGKRARHYAQAVDNLADTNKGWVPNAKLELEAARDRLKAVSDGLTGRVDTATQCIDALTSSPQVDGSVAQLGRDALAGDVDVSTLTDISADVELIKARRLEVDDDAINTLKISIIDAWCADDHHLSSKRATKIKAWVAGGLDKINVSEVDFKAEITKELNSQHRIVKGQWLQKFGFNKWGRLWGADSVGSVSGINVHASLYKDKMAAAIDVSTNDTATTMDRLLTSGNTGFHVTMEAFGKYGDGGKNPHAYRGGPTRRGDYAGSDWDSSARGELNGLLAGEEARIGVLVNDIVTSKGASLEDG